MFGSFFEQDHLLPLFRMAGKKALSTSFSLVTSTNLGISPKTFWLLVLTLLSHWCKTSRLYLVPVLNYWTSTRSTPQKNWFFWSNSYKIEVMIISLIEMLELPNFSNMTKSTIQFETHDEMLLVTSQPEIMTS